MSTIRTNLLAMLTCSLLLPISLHGMLSTTETTANKSETDLALEALNATFIKNNGDMIKTGKELARNKKVDSIYNLNRENGALGNILDSKIKQLNSAGHAIPLKVEKFIKKPKKFLKKPLLTILQKLAKISDKSYIPKKNSNADELLNLVGQSIFLEKFTRAIRWVGPEEYKEMILKEQ